MLGEVSSDVLLFVTAAFAGAVVAGMAGFAFGLVASALWLHVITPAESAALISAFAVIVQGMGLWALRKSIDLCRLTPYLIGTAVGVPLGVVMLSIVSPEHMRAAIGAVVVLFSLYSLLRPGIAIAESTPRAGIVGLLGGVLGGSTGLGGLTMIVWAAARQWAKEQQRAMFQPVAVATFLMSLVWMGGAGVLTANTARLFMWGLPAVVIGTWLGLKLFGKLNEKAYRTTVLLLLLLSGLTLLAPIVSRA